MEYLSSLKNPRVQFWRSLRDTGVRRENQLFLIEGKKMVSEALGSDFTIDTLLIRDDLQDTLENLPAHIPVCVLPEHILAAVCDTRTPQGIAAILKIPEQTSACGPRLIALDGVQDPGNVGTILRTADAAGFTGVLLSSSCADVFSPKVLRATMGSIFRMGITVTGNLAGSLHSLRGEGYSIISSQLDGEPFYERSPVNDCFCLIIGNEGNGISENVKKSATHRLKLPMRGGAESLNAAVAAGIMMYELTRTLL